MFKKILLWLVALLLAAIIGILIYVNTGITLPKETNNVIKEVLASDLPEIVKGETAFAKSGELDIWYEKLGSLDSLKGTVLLVMGHSSTAIFWTNNFCQTYIDDGYQVIRYDNRDVGMSSWIDNWDKNKPYTLEDMAADGIAVLDDAGVKSAHIIGVSMGGMIAQRMAISYSERVLSLTSIMSTGFLMDPDIAPVPSRFTGSFTKLGLKYLTNPSESNQMKFFIGVDQLLKGDGPL